jgi:hypothetical protein
MDEIISAKHVCERDRAKNLRQWFFKAANRMLSSGTAYTGRVSGEGVQAYINNGRWLAHCGAGGCQGKEYVRADEPIFFCLSCGNRLNNGDARPVEFPENWHAIELALLKRPIILGLGNTQIQQIYNSRPRNLPREWMPPQTLDDLETANREAGL